VPEPCLLVWGGRCKVENIYRNVRICGPSSKIKEACVKKLQIPVKSSLYFACLSHRVTYKRHATFKYYFSKETTEKNNSRHWFEESRWPQFCFFTLLAQAHEAITTFKCKFTEENSSKLFCAFFPAEAQAYSTDPVYLCIFSTQLEQPLSIHRQGEKLRSSMLKVNMAMPAVLMFWQSLAKSQTVTFFIVNNSNDDQEKTERREAMKLCKWLSEH
jgi:hypothetical protein